jgi:autotransporter-associated beta strand protein
MRIRLIRMTWAAIAGLLLSGSVHAAPIAWGTVQNISGPGSTTVSTTKTQGGPGGNVTITNGTNDVNTQGTQVFGINYSGVPFSTFPYTTTINGQNFYSYRDPSPLPVTYNVTELTDPYVGYGPPGAAGQSYGNSNSGGVGPNPDYTLANAVFSHSTTGSVTLGNLTLGHQYLVQFWVSDPRNNGVVQTRVETLTSSTGGDTNAPTLAYQGPGSIDGQWVTGTFVANSSLAETLNLVASNTNSSTGDSGSPQINLLQLRDISVTVTSSWTGTSSANWADSGNWTGAVPGATAGTTNTDTAVFNQFAPQSPLTIDAGRNIQNITFDTANVNSLTIGTVGGQALLLTVGGVIQTSSTVVNPQTVNAPLVLEGDYTFTTDASSSSATLSFRGGIAPAATSGVTTLTLNGANSGANTISGVLADNGAGQLAVTKDGAGVWILSGANAYSGGTTVLGGTLKFQVTSGTPTVAAGVTATVAAGATLELAGSISALGAAGGNREHIVNNSLGAAGQAAGLVVSGQNQVVGAIDGLGSTQVNAGSNLTADHIIQNALVIGGTAGSHGLVTIDASDASGNPLGQSSGHALAGSLLPSGPFGSDGNSSANLSSEGGSDRASLSPGSSIVGGASTSVPEPSTLLLALFAVLGVVSTQFVRHHARCQRV